MNWHHHQQETLPRVTSPSTKTISHAQPPIFFTPFLCMTLPLPITSYSNVSGMLRTVLRRVPRRQQSTSAQSAPRPSTEPETKSTSPPRRRRPPAALEVTPTAAARIRELLSQKTPRPAGVRIGLRTRGCNGMAYTLNYADERNKFDERVSIEGAEVFIDPRALMHIVGTKMDFVDNDLVSEFVFHNPNAKGTCGCGESFNV